MPLTYKQVDDMTPDEFRKAADEAKTLEDMFLLFYVPKYEEDTPPDIVNRLRASFMAGAASFMKVEHQAVDKADSVEAAKKALDTIRAEIMAYALSQVIKKADKS